MLDTSSHALTGTGTKYIVAGPLLRVFSSTSWLFLSNLGCISNGEEASSSSSSFAVVQVSMMVHLHLSFGAVIALAIVFSGHTTNGLQLAKRELRLQLDPRDGSPPEAQFQEMEKSGGPAAAFGEMPLSGRDLIDSWLGKRACVDAGYVPCTTSYGCCPSGETCCSLGCCDAGKSCCPSSLYCAEAGGKCCGSLGTCRVGWNCCGYIGCYPDGGECCSDGNYCEAGNHCYIVNGLHVCCTNSQCTAHVSNGVTSTRGGGAATTGDTKPTSAPPVVTVPTTATSTTSTTSTTPLTAAPTPTAVNIVAIDYFFTYTWYYWYWYWVYTTRASTVTTSSTYSTVYVTTTVTIKETDSLSARSSFLDISRTIATSAPSEASSVYFAPSPSPQVIGASASSATSTPLPTVGNGGAQTGAVTATAGSAASAGAKSSATHVLASLHMSSAITSFLGLSLVSAFLMVWL